MKWQQRNCGNKLPAVHCFAIFNCEAVDESKIIVFVQFTFSNSFREGNKKTTNQVYRPMTERTCPLNRGRTPLTITAPDRNPWKHHHQTFTLTLTLNLETTVKSLGAFDWGTDDWDRPAQSPSRCTKCNNPPINGLCTNFVIRCFTIITFTL